jgi:tetratricopeptide (TPR) repeat protein
MGYSNSMGKRSRAVKRIQESDRTDAAGSHQLRWLLAIGSSSILVYLNTLGNGFVYDDHFLVERSWLVQNQDFASVFTTHYWAGYAGNETGHYRPLTILSLLLDSLGGVNPFRYHLTNLILHTLNSLIAFLLCRQIGLTALAAGIAGLLFSIHPVHAEVAAGVTFGRSDLLAGGFLLSGLLLYSIFRTKGRESCYWWSIAAFFCGLVSKESALTLIGLVVLYDLGRSKAGWRAIPGLVSQCWLRWSGFVATFILCLLVRQLAAGLGFSPDSMSVLVNPLFGAPIWLRLLTAAKLYWNYAVLLVFPASLSVDYSYNAVPIAEFPPGFPVYAGLVLGLTTLVLWVRAFGRWPLAFLCGALFWVPYSAVSQTVILLNSMCQERFLYVPVLGVFALAGFGSEYLYGRYRTVAIVMLVLVVGGYAFRTVARNREWKDDMTLFSSAVSTYPGSAKMHHALADVMAESGHIDEAILGFRHALSIREEAMTYNNLGNAYGLKGDLKRAVPAYQKAVEIEPDYAEAWTNLGVTGLRFGKAQLAADAFSKASALKPDDYEVKFNLARSLEAKGDVDGAAKAYERALKLQPNWPEARFNLGKVYSEQARWDDAVNQYERFLETWKGDSQFADGVRRRILVLKKKSRGEAVNQ